MAEEDSLQVYLDQKLAERVQARRQFTLAEKKLLEVSGEDFRAEELSVQRLEQRATVLRTLDAEVQRTSIKLGLLGLDEEYDKAEEYEERFRAAVYDVEFRRQSRATATIPPDAHHKPAAAAHVAAEGRLHLPKLSVKSFNVQPRTWLAFWAQFSRIHNDESLEEELKFQYLIQSVEPGSKAASILESFPPTKENYLKALEALKARFGRKQLLIDVHVRDLMEVIQNPGKSLTDFYDRLHVQIKSLESLGMTSKSYSLLLCPLVESCLPADTLRQWERRRLDDLEGSGDGGGDSDDEANPLEDLMAFLEREVLGEERVGMSSSITNPPSAAALVTKVEVGTAEAKIVCMFCDGSHGAEQCQKAARMSIDDRVQAIKDKRGCFKCLKAGHFSSRCRARISCLICQRNHSVLLCARTGTRQGDQRRESKKGDSAGDSSHRKKALLTTGNGTVFLQTLLCRIGKDQVVRALLDSAAERSYITAATAEKLQLTATGSVTLRHSLFGGVTTKAEKSNKFRVCLSALNGVEQIQCEVVEKSVICSELRQVYSSQLRKELQAKGILLTDIEPGSKAVDLLLGADVMGRLLTGKVVPLKTGPLAVETVLGWTLLGGTPGNDSSQVTLSLSAYCKSEDVSSLWDLHSLGILDPAGQQSKQLQCDQVMQNMLSETRVASSGRYQVRFPWKHESIELAGNKNLSMARLHQTTKKLRQQNLYDDYDRALTSWHERGIVERVSPSVDAAKRVHYLPHKAVIRNSSSTTIRPVFDASAKPSKDALSLNDCLESGPNYIARIPEVLTRFRCGAVGIVSDISKAFLQIELHPDDRDFVRFFWWDEKGEVCEYRHCRVVFGLTCSPAHLCTVVALHLQKHVHEFPDVVRRLTNSFYVDDLVTAFPTQEKADEFQEQASQLMARGHFELAKWSRNGERVEQNPAASCQLVNVLGLCWDLDQDALSCSLPKFSPQKAVTKRELLSLVASIFDILGFWCPVLVKPKKLLQEAWKRNLPWDEPLPTDLLAQFRLWFQVLPLLAECKIPRSMCVQLDETCELHVFCDASAVAYAASVFLRVATQGCINVQLVQARSRIAPLENVSIPRLELMAATIAARLVKTVQETLKLEKVRTILWSDSMVALTWITCSGCWAPFVRNRVKEIRSLTDPLSWRFVPGEVNPADLPSRGCDARQLLESKWWTGPRWLHDPEDKWPNRAVQPSEEANTEAAKHVLVAVEEKLDPLDLGRNMSNFRRIVRVVAWILRWKNKRKGSLGNEEVLLAKGKLLLYVQQHVTRGTLNSLQVDVDRDGLLRVRTKLLADVDSFDRPVLLPRDHPVVQRLVEHEHRVHLHAGVATLMSIMRQTYWLVQARRTIKKVVSRCVVCRRHAAKRMEVQPPVLPRQRTEGTRCFQFAGVDMCGPLVLKGNTKVWIAVFTCATFRAVHLELVDSLSTEAFQRALRRFIARRGRVEVVFSDNGTNFTGLHNLLKEVDWTQIEDNANVHCIQWRFQAPSAPWWGGFFERMIQIIKGTLKRCLGKAALATEELLTVLCETEALINNRPLTYSAEDELTPLTPAFFLHGAKSDVPDLDFIDTNILRRRARYAVQLREALCKRFKEEYLGALSQKGCRASRPPRVGEIVLLGSDTKRVLWPLAKVEELLPGHDSVVRTVRVRTAGGFLVRPVQRLYSLEVFGGDGVLSGALPPPPVQPGDAGSADVHTRSGRHVRKPARFKD